MGTLYGRRRYLFIVGHMRGCTSVLAHVLGSHPRVRGYREHHIAYHSVAALKKLVRSLDSEFPGARDADGYLLDKLLHDHLPLAPFVLDSPDVRVLFVLRTPEPTLRSLCAALPDFDEARALAYYTARLSTLACIAAQPALDPARAMFLESASLFEDCETAFARLQRWLALGEPLSRHYRLFRHSGEPGHGDTSPRLLSGRLATTPRTQGPGLAPQTVARARAAWSACREALSRAIPG